MKNIFKRMEVKTLDRSLRDSGFHGPFDLRTLLKVGELKATDGRNETKEISLEHSKYSEQELLDLANNVLGAYSSQCFADSEIYIVPGKLVGIDSTFAIYKRDSS